MSKGWNKFLNKQTFSNFESKKVTYLPQLSNRKLFSFCPFELNSPEEAYELIKGLLLSGFIIALEKNKDNSFTFIEIPLKLGEKVTPLPFNYVYEVMCDGSIKFIDSDKKERFD